MEKTDEIKDDHVALSEALIEGLNQSAIIAITDVWGIITYANKKFSEISGFAIEELIGQDHRIINSGYHSKEFIKTLWETVAGGEVWKGEVKNKAKNGDYYWVNTTIVPFLDEEGKPYQYFVVRFDITKEREAVALNLNIAKIIEESLNEIFIFSQGDLRFVNVNKGAIANIGYTFEELSQMTPIDIKPEFTESMFRDYVEPLLKGKVESLDLETMHQRKDGTQYPCKINIQRATYESKPVYVAFIYDITKEKAAIEGSINLGRILEESLNEIFICSQEDLKFVKANRGALRNIGYSIEELIQMTPMDITLEFTEKQFRAYVDPLLKGDVNGFDLEMVHQRKDGTQYPCRINVQRATYESKPVYVAFINDVTKQKEDERTRIITESKLAEKVNLLAGIENVQSEFIKNIDKKKAFNLMLEYLLDYTNSEYGFIGEVLYDGRVPYLKTHAITNIAWNEETTKFYKEHAPKGMEFRNLKSLFGEVLTTQDYVISDNPYTDERRGGLPKGHPPLNKFLGVPVKKGNTLLGVIGISNRPGGYSEDIVEELSPFVNTCANLIEAVRINELKEKAERTLSKTIEKLRKANNALDSFAYRVSHDLKSPAINMSSMVSMLKESIDIKDNPFVDEIIENIDISIKRMKNIIEALLELSKIERKSENEKMNILLHDACEVVRGSFINQLKELDVEINADFSGCEEVYFSDTELYSILQNLLTNSIKYRKKDGSLRIDVHSEKLDGFDVITYADNGIGMDLEKYGHKLFKMFERLHMDRDIEGTGVGLHIVKKMIENSNGTISVQSQVGKGTTFRISLPQKEENEKVK